MKFCVCILIAAHV
uniref:Uncharacterized protein n=1 Tax=Anguilla anguilla TaxID=7936 RepID=A0A0E9TT71_ANGAN